MEPIKEFFDLSPLQWEGIVTSILCSSMIGLERQLSGKPAGVRTSILICLGTYSFVSMADSIIGVGTDNTRVIGQIITGIGFLGAGVMLTREGLVIGVTSAAVIWMLASIGSMVGLHYYKAAIILAILTVSVLVGVNILERIFKKMKSGVHKD
jgi:putative Mg2+ transporter-C (MgtC) family protein